MFPARVARSGYERLEILACDRFQHRIGVGFEEFPPSGRFHLALPLELKPLQHTAALFDIGDLFLVVGTPEVPIG